MKSAPSFRPEVLAGSVLVFNNARSRVPPETFGFGATPVEDAIALPPVSVQVLPCVINTIGVGTPLERIVGEAGGATLKSLL